MRATAHTGTKAALLCSIALLGGCFASHDGAGVPFGSEPTDPSPSEPIRRPRPDAGRILVDAGPVVVDGGTPREEPVDPEPTPIPGPGCNAYLDGHPFPTCDASDFGECTRAIEGVACCFRHVACQDGVVAESIFCDDVCDQSCRAVANAPDCVAFGCEWFQNDACGPAPPGVVEGPLCIPRRGIACTSDDECPLGQLCTPFYIDPCEGAMCDACGGIVGYCTPPF
jgi:hypothetical protein